MKFEITRTSIFCGEETAPCDGARREKYLRVDRRTVDDPMKNPYIGESWYLKGKNHRIEDGQIARDLDCERWVIDIDDLSQLCDFLREHGDLVVSVNYDSNPPCMSIEIYDSYRE